MSDDAPTAPPEEAGVFHDTLMDLVDTPAHMIAALHLVEETARTTLGDRLLEELLSNARDALVAGRQAGGRILVRLTADGLTVANDGARLTRAGYEALCGMCVSDKASRAVGGGFRPLVRGTVRPIGGGGIGFKCVLRASARPQLLANTPGDGRFAVELGAERLKPLCAALARADAEALDGLLSDTERAVVAEELTRDRPLTSRSLVVHLGRRGVSLDRLLERLPVTPFPLWLHDVAPDLQALLGWSGSPPDDKPYDTVVHLPFVADRAHRLVKSIREEVPGARRTLLGVHAKLRIQDEAD